MIPTIPIFSPYERGLVSQIQGLLNTAQRNLRIIPKSQASTFINPFEVRGELRTACFYGIVDIAVVEGELEGKLILCLLSSNNPHKSLLDKLVNGRGIPVWIYDALDQKYKILEGIRAELRKTASKESVTNYFERWLIDLTRMSLNPWRDRRFYESLGRVEWYDEILKQYNLYHEPALGSFIDLNAITKDKDHDFARKTRVDVLVTAATDVEKPLLVIEFDGRQHDEEDQLRKDEAKDSLLVAAGIAVVRIRISDVPNKNNTVIPIESKWKHNIDMTFDYILRHIIHGVVEQMHKESVLLPDLRNQYEELLESMTIDAINAFISEHGLKPPVTEIESVRRRIVGDPELVRLQHEIWDQESEQTKLGAEWAADRLIKSLFEKYNATFEEPTFTVLDNGISGRAKFTYKNMIYVIQTPRIRIGLKGVAGRTGQSFAAEAIDTWIRNEAQAIISRS